MVNARRAAEEEHQFDQLEAVLRAEVRTKAWDMEKDDLVNLLVGAAELINYVAGMLAAEVAPTEDSLRRVNVKLFGIFNGWDEDRWAGIQMRHQIPLAQVRRLQRYHATVERLIK